MKVDPGFRVPQQFLYLQNLPKLQQHLRKAALDESLKSSDGRIRLRGIANSERATFIRSVKKHISKGYSETGRLYAEKLLSISEEGEDPEGFLTTAKCVRVIVFNKRRVGFVVLTFKLGGCVKTGPVILGEKHRSRGVGKLLRQHIHKAVFNMGYRKVFAAVPADNVPAFQYLLSSGYHIEAHLIRPYHRKHDELVFGRLLDHKRGPGPEFIRQITPATAFERVTEPVPEISGFIDREFSSAYCRVPEGWAAQQLRMACSGKADSSKPRLIFAATSEGLLAVCICLLKRGGSAKLVILTKTGHQPSLIEFLQFIEGQVAGSANKGIRRLYTQVPVKDSDLTQAFLDLGYRAEGVIEQPFSPNSDTLILAKHLN
jgi:hypothetical protein